MISAADTYFLGGILGYVAGSVPFGVVLTRFAGVGDIRAIGSGNIGATNVLRTGRKGLAAATLLLDGAKGALAVWLCWEWINPSPLALALAGLMAVVGHIFPVWLGLRGGKGVATGLGVIAALCWPAGLLACATWLLVAKLSRISSAGALAAFVVAPLAVFGLSDHWRALAVLGIALLVFWRHQANIQRLLAGTEPRIGAAK
jgi:glycerol-3-phosphate acyltransferase PlsY